MWIVFLVFKGNDLHSGFAPTEDPEAHRRWVQTVLTPLWNMTGKKNRVGYVSYLSEIAKRRLGSLNVSPPTLFGNFGSSQIHKENQKNYTEHGLVALGGHHSYSNRIGREALYNFWNSLRLGGLALNMSLSDLVQKITYQDPESDLPVPLEHLPFCPDSPDDITKIKRMLALYSWYVKEGKRVLFRHITIAGNNTDAAQTKAALAEEIRHPPIFRPVDHQRPPSLSVGCVADGEGEGISSGVNLPIGLVANGGNVVDGGDERDKRSSRVVNPSKQKREQEDQKDSDENTDEEEEDVMGVASGTSYEVEHILGHNIDENVCAHHCKSPYVLTNDRLIGGNDLEDQVERIR